MSFSDIPAGKDLPNDINVIIEIPANHDPIKYEVDKDSDAIILPANIWHEAVAIENNTIFNSLFLKDVEY